MPMMSSEEYQESLKLNFKYLYLINYTHSMFELYGLQFSKKYVDSYIYEMWN